jgi:hypothetical protein
MASTTVSQIKQIWEVIELVVAQCIQTAEVLHGPKTGPEKKAYVVNETMRFLNELEAKHNLLPGMFEAAALAGVRFALEQLVERVLKQQAPATA